MIYIPPKNNSRYSSVSFSSSILPFFRRGKRVLPVDIYIF